MAQSSLSKAGIAPLFLSQTAGVSLDSRLKPCFTSPVILGRKSASNLYLLYPLLGDCQVQQPLCPGRAQGWHHYSPWVPLGAPGWLAWVPGPSSPWCRGRRWWGERGKVQLQLPGMQKTSASGKLGWRDKEMVKMLALPFSCTGAKTRHLCPSSDLLWVPLV